jgi:hypothetical protein
VPPAVEPPAREPIRLGVVGGRSLLVITRGRDVVIAWGDETLAAARQAAREPASSAAAYCTCWAREGKRPPERVGAFWPARCWSSWQGVDARTPAVGVLTEAPPAVWWGWNDAGKARDSLTLGDLRRRVRRFLDQLPLDPSSLR